jgi:peptide chain release factor 1
VTVAVLPEAEEVDVHIDPAGPRNHREPARAVPVRQGVNTTDSAVQILQQANRIDRRRARDERSQLKNKAKAMTVLRCAVF